MDARDFDFITPGRSPIRQDKFEKEWLRIHKPSELGENVVRFHITLNERHADGTWRHLL